MAINFKKVFLIVKNLRVKYEFGPYIRRYSEILFI